MPPPRKNKKCSGCCGEAAALFRDICTTTMIDLTPFKSDIEKIYKDLSLRKLDIIGSATRDDFSDKSDIDVLVTFSGDENLFDRYFGLMAGQDTHY